MPRLSRTAITACLLLLACGEGDGGASGGSDTAGLVDVSLDAAGLDVAISDTGTAGGSDSAAADGGPADSGTPDTSAADGGGGGGNDTLVAADGAACATAQDCPKASGPCVEPVCLPSGTCVEQALPDTTVCDDGDPCTLSSLCKAGACSAGAAKPCDDDNACTEDSCDPADGSCANKPLPGAPCDDGSKCTDKDACDDKGTCSGGELVCACATSDDCAKFEDGDTCNGTLYCDADTAKCVVNPASVVTCPTAKDTACLKNTCDKSKGTCSLTPVTDGTSCDDGEKCTVNDACDKGSCKAGQQVCCQSDADCGKFEDGDVCNGTLYCDKAAGTCKLNPSTLVVCPSAYDTGCRKNTCDKKTGACQLQDEQDGKPCDDGNACTPNDTCAKGECSATANNCKCQSDKDCAAFEDGDLCNGTLYCDVADPKPHCKVNPVTVVFCATVDDTDCAKNTCDPKTGKCSVVPLPDQKPCDGDGNPCTAKDRCLGGACKVDANTCPCQSDAECQAKEDGNLCNGTLYCNKASNVCEVNPATLVSCPSALDTQCVKNRCQPTTGQCQMVKEPDYSVCDVDGTLCTLNDACIQGKCTLGKNLCQCKVDGHCDRFEDLDQCNGTLYCNKKGQPYVCSPNPASKVFCEKSQDGPCLKNLCLPASGKCKLTAIDEGKACSDGDQCKTKPMCKAGQCAGGKLDCDDGNPCTDDGCDPDKGCVALPKSATACDDGNPCTTDTCDPKVGAAGKDGCVHVLMKTGATCEDGDLCTKGDSCQGGACAAGKVADCDDDNPCSVDGCDKKTGCTHVAGQEGKVCDDGDACTAATACTKGFCKGSAVDCDDDQPCTTDACDPKASGKDPCLHVPKVQGQACDDGNPCTWADACDVKGACGGKAKDCDDGKLCTTDTCDPKVGCAHMANQLPCDDGDVCTKGDVCAGGACLPGEATLCNDGNACTTDSCDKAKGGCVHTPSNAPCSDGSVCTTDDACDAKGQCTGKAKVCDDNQLCTSDSCDPKVGCVFAPNTLKCVDGDSCTTDDRCKGGKCTGKPADCGDGNPCTTDACDAKTGCTHAANTDDCDDANPCTTGEACKDKLCQGGKPTVCDDGKPCTKDACVGSKGCVATAIDGGSCDDGDPCTAITVCSKGVCSGGSKTDCDDGNPCTADTCGAGGSGKGCVHTAQPGACDDGNACTTGDLCGDGVCLPGEASPCNDGNPCTTDSCDPDGKKTGTKGCVHAAASGVCDDGDLCTESDACAQGKCAGKKKSCDDSEPCTADTCDPKLGCQNKGVDVPCIDGDSCTTKDKCIGGKCVGQKVDCSDGNPCTDDSCDAKKGCVHTPNKTGCDDGNACTSGDVCANGSCTSGKVKSCDDGNACTTGSCHPLLGCQQSAKSGSCDDSDACTVNDACTSGACLGKPASCDDSNACTDDSCDPKTGKCVHSANSASCSDGDACTTGESCTSGSCSGGKSISCDDGNDCTDDACSKTLGCVAVANSAPCDDGDACTTSDVCGKGSCSGTEVTCDDGDPCTVDSCDPATGGCAKKPGNDGTVCGGGGRWCHAGVCKWAKAIDGGRWHNCGLHPNGTASCWGSNDYGALGNGVIGGIYAKPVLVKNLTGITNIEGGEYATCALTDKQEVWCWGVNQFNSLNTGSAPNAVSTPRKVVTLGGKALALSVGHTHRCALRDDGRVRCWGSGTGGQLGNKKTNGGYTSVMSTVLGLQDAVDLHCSGRACLAHDKHGKLFTWGYNFGGQLGLGYEDKYVSSAIAHPLRKDLVQYSSTLSAACHRTSANKLFCAGSNDSGMLGLGYTSYSGKVYVPAQLRRVPEFVDVGAGLYHTCAVDKSGEVWCWGNSDYGEIGQKADAHSPTKLTMSGRKGSVVQVRGAEKATCALTDLGEVWCWGQDDKGLLGRNAVTKGGPVPEVVPASAAVSAALCQVPGACDDGDPCTTDSCDLKTGKCSHTAGNDGATCGAGLVCSAGGCKAPHAVAIAAGDDHTCALRVDGGVDCWGDGASGQLGDGTTTSGGKPLAKKVSVGGLGGRPVALALGGATSCARFADGSARCWGANDSGQAGRAGGAVLSSAGKVTVADTLLGVAVGGAHSCGLHESGGVLCWGAGSSGQLGDGKGASSASAVAVVGVAGARAVAAGAKHSCALTWGGAVLCWGDNASGQLGGGSTGGSAKAPVAVQGISDAIAIAAGGAFTCALRSMGGVRCWGANADSQLGRGAVSAASASAANVGGVNGAVAIAAGDRHACAVTGAGAVWCWGRNASGQAGQGGSGAVLKPTQVSGVGDAAAIAAGRQHTCALRRDGQVRCWGTGGKGQLGGGSASSASPVAVVGTAALADQCKGKVCDDGDPCTEDRCLPATGACQALPRADGSACGEGLVCAAGACKPAFARRLSTGRYHSCVIRHSGAPWCWGANGSDEVSAGEASFKVSAPVAVKGLDAAADLGLGYKFSCAVDTAGKAQCWGRAQAYETGRGANHGDAEPGLVKDLDPVARVVAGDATACAITAAGGLWCWGEGSAGQIGDGGTSDRATPVKVALAEVSDAALKSTHGCAVHGGGKVSCWGANGYGQLGDGTTTSRAKPALVSGIDDASAIAVGGEHSCAVRAGGRVSCWGRGLFGRLGSGASQDSATPVEVVGAGGVVDIAAGLAHTCVATGLGRVLCWGNDTHGALGIGVTTVALVATEVSGISGAVEVSAGDDLSCARRANGSVACWGWQSSGMVGNGKTSGDATTPTPVNGSAPGVNLCVANKVTCDDKDPCTTDVCVPETGKCVAKPVADGASCGGDRQCYKGGCMFATQLAAGNDTTCALRPDGGVKCWGKKGEPLGPKGLGQDHDKPIDVPVEPSVQLVRTKYAYCVLNKTGEVQCWGYGNDGVLGWGAAVSSALPVWVIGIQDAVAIYGSGRSVCAVHKSGTVKCWGGNKGDYELGGGYGWTYPVPITVKVPEGMVKMGTFWGNNHAAITDKEELWIWGDNSDGQIGTGQATSSGVKDPTKIALTKVSSVVGLWNTICAVHGGGKVSCWGSNNYGEVATGTTSSADVTVPTQISSISGAVQLASGNLHACALLGTGAVKCWGRNNDAQLGMGKLTPYQSAVTVDVVKLSDAVEITAGDEHTCARKKDGSVVCWGANTYGQLGLGEHAYGDRRHTPEPVAGSAP